MSDTCQHIWEDAEGDNHECGERAFHSGPHKCDMCNSTKAKPRPDGSEA